MFFCVCLKKTQFVSFSKQKNATRKNESSFFKYYRTLIFFKFCFCFYLFHQKVKKNGTFLLIIWSVLNQSFICFVLWLGWEKHDSFRFYFMNTIMLFSVNVSILLSIRSFTFLNVFVSFLYRRLFYQRWVTFLASTFAPNFDEGHKECMTGGMQLQNMRNARQDRGRT